MLLLLDHLSLSFETTPLVHQVKPTTSDNVQITTSNLAQRQRNNCFVFVKTLALWLFVSLFSAAAGETKKQSSIFSCQTPSNNNDLDLDLDSDLDNKEKKRAKKQMNEVFICSSNSNYNGLLAKRKLRNNNIIFIIIIHNSETSAKTTTTNSSKTSFLLLLPSSSIENLEYPAQIELNNTISARRANERRRRRLYKLALEMMMQKEAASWPVSKRRKFCLVSNDESSSYTKRLLSPPRVADGGRDCDTKMMNRPSERYEEEDDNNNNNNKITRKISLAGQIFRPPFSLSLLLAGNMATTTMMIIIIRAKVGFGARNNMAANNARQSERKSNSTTKTISINSNSYLGPLTTTTTTRTRPPNSSNASCPAIHERVASAHSRPSKQSPILLPLLFDVLFNFMGGICSAGPAYLMGPPTKKTGGQKCRGSAGSTFAQGRPAEAGRRISSAGNSRQLKQRQQQASSLLTMLIVLLLIQQLNVFSNCLLANSQTLTSTKLASESGDLTTTFSLKKQTYERLPDNRNYDLTASMDDASGKVSEECSEFQQPEAGGNKRGCSSHLTKKRRATILQSRNYVSAYEQNDFEKSLRTSQEDENLILLPAPSTSIGVNLKTSKAKTHGRLRGNRRHKISHKREDFLSSLLTSGHYQPEKNDKKGNPLRATNHDNKGHSSAMEPARYFTSSVKPNYKLEAENKLLPDNEELAGRTNYSNEINSDLIDRQELPEVAAVDKIGGQMFCFVQDDDEDEDERNKNSAGQDSDLDMQIGGRTTSNLFNQSYKSKAQVKGAARDCYLEAQFSQRLSNFNSTRATRWLKYCHINFRQEESYYNELNRDHFVIEIICCCREHFGSGAGQLAAAHYHKNLSTTQDRNRTTTSTEGK